MLITKFMNNGENFFGLFILSILGVEIIALAILNILFIIESFTLRLIKEKCHLIGLSLCLITYIVGTIYILVNKYTSTNIFLIVLEVLLSIIITIIILAASFKCFGNIEDLLEINIASKNLANICENFENFMEKYNQVKDEYNNLNLQIEKLGKELNKKFKYKNIYDLEYPQSVPIISKSDIHIFHCNYDPNYDIIGKVNHYQKKIEKIMYSAQNNMIFIQSIIDKKTPLLEEYKKMLDNDEKIKSIINDKKLSSELFDNSDDSVIFDSLSEKSVGEKKIKSKIKKWKLF